MQAKKFFELAHHLLTFTLIFSFILIPLKYIKYIAWIPLAVVVHWVIFNGCILDILHHDNANVGTTLTDNFTSILELFNKPLASYINEKYLQNTNRTAYISAFTLVLLTTIACYRLIFNIDILNYFNLLKI